MVSCALLKTRSTRLKKGWVKYEVALVWNKGVLHVTRLWKGGSPNRGEEGEHGERGEDNNNNKDNNDSDPLCIHTLSLFPRCHCPDSNPVCATACHLPRSQHRLLPRVRECDLLPISLLIAQNRISAKSNQVEGV